jgi:lysophospholipase L1-like esterase
MSGTRLLRVTALILAVGFESLLVAQNNAPAKNESTVSAADAAAAQRALEWKRSREALPNDWGELAQFRADNERLVALPSDPERVVFFGDSITKMWKLDEYFPGKSYVNRGIGGQTTPQMVVRFRQDVIALHPRTVVILGGTNDIAGNTGPMLDADIIANYVNMTELARANGIQVIFCSITPVHNYVEGSQNLFQQRPLARIQTLNRWLKEYSAANGIPFIDLYSPMVDSTGLLRRELADDGLHPTAAGYRIMAELVNEALKNLPAKK